MTNVTSAIFSVCESRYNRMLAEGLPEKDATKAVVAYLEDLQAIHRDSKYTLEFINSLISAYSQTICRRPIMTTAEWITEHPNLCKEAEIWLASQPDIATAWEACHRSDWMLWAIRQNPKLVERLGKRVFVDFAVQCAEHTPPLWTSLYPGDSRPLAAITAARNWLDNPTVENAATAAAAAAATAAAWAAAAAAPERQWQADRLRQLIQNPFLGDQS